MLSYTINESNNIHCRKISFELNTMYTYSTTHNKTLWLLWSGVDWHITHNTVVEKKVIPILIHIGCAWLRYQSIHKQFETEAIYIANIVVATVDRFTWKLDNNSVRVEWTRRKKRFDRKQRKCQWKKISRQQIMRYQFGYRTIYFVVTAIKMQLECVTYYIVPHNAKAQTIH